MPTLPGGLAFREERKNKRTRDWGPWGSSIYSYSVTSCVTWGPVLRVGGQSHSLTCIQVLIIQYKPHAPEALNLSCCPSSVLTSDVFLQHLNTNFIPPSSPEKKSTSILTLPQIISLPTPQSGEVYILGGWGGVVLFFISEIGHVGYFRGGNWGWK